MARRNPKVSINLETIAVDVRDACLGAIRSTGKAWPTMSESEQRLTSERLYNLGVEVATKAAIALQGAGQRHVKVALGSFQVTDKGSIKATIGIGDPDDAVLGELMDMRGKQCLLVNADASDYTNARREVAIDLDQKVLALENEDGDEGEEGLDAALDGLEDGEGGDLDSVVGLVGQWVRTAGGNVGQIVVIHAAGSDGVERADIRPTDGGPLFKRAAIAEYLDGPPEGYEPDPVPVPEPAPEPEKAKKGRKPKAESPAAQAAADAGIGE